jgi:hypothetical protein
MTIEKNSISILCRGKSLKDISTLPVCETLILVNSFQKELEIPEIDDYVKKHNNIIHITSVGAEFYPMVERGVHSKYNFKSMVLPYVKECLPPSTPDFIFSIKDKDGKLLPVTHMSDKNKEDMVGTHRYKFTAPTCGMDSVLYAVNDLRADELFIIGLDFYDGVGYFTNSHGIRDASDKEAIHRGEDPETIKSFFINFVKKHKDVKFNIITMSDLQNTSDIKNLNVNRR